MSIENLNNTESWRSKLDDLEGLPGDTRVDKNAAYEKLHARLRGKKRSRKAMWYWAAAACLLLAFMIPLIFKKNKIHPVAGIEAEHKQQEKMPDDINTKRVKKDPVTIIGPLIEKEKEVVAPGKINRTNHKIIPVEIKNKIRLYDTVIPTDLAKENISNSLQPVDSASSIAATLPPGKKLKVIHINELGDPVEVSPETVNKKELRSFQLELASQEVYSHSPVAFNKSGFTIFKTKSSSN